MRKAYYPINAVIVIFMLGCHYCGHDIVAIKETLSEYDKTDEICIGIHPDKLGEINKEILIWKAFEKDFSQCVIRDKEFINYTEYVNQYYPENHIIDRNYLLDKYDFLKRRSKDHIYYGSQYHEWGIHNETHEREWIKTPFRIYLLENNFRDYIYFDWEVNEENARQLLAVKDPVQDIKMDWHYSIQFAKDEEEFSPYRFGCRRVPIAAYLKIQDEIQQARPESVIRRITKEDLNPEPYLDRSGPYYHEEYIFYHGNGFKKMVVEIGNGFYLARAEKLIQGPEVPPIPRFGSTGYIREEWKLKEEQIPREVREYERVLEPLFAKYDIKVWQAAE